jgi:hypothetical protein
MADDRIPDLLRSIDDLRDAKQRAQDDLAMVIVERRDAGDSVRSLAQTYGVPPSTIHNLTQRGRVLRDNGVHAPRRVVSDGSPSNVLPVWLQWAIVAAVMAGVVAQVVDLLLLAFGRK